MNSKVQDYMEIIEKVVRIEQKRIPNHMVEQEELISIGIIAVQSLIKGKTKDELEKYNKSYVGTAVRWAIRNELRNRYKWYSFKHGEKQEAGGDDENGDGLDVAPERLREGIYEAVLSIDSIAESSDNDSPFDFLKDGGALPEERLELIELSRAIKKAIASLPPKERTIVEYRFYRNLQIKDIATQLGLSSSRITRIVQSALNNIREYLIENDQV
ncbi:MAG: sigma-70 family RNA polymerase sigma factor [Candidatus Gastranaerophilales bacterium]|nr:sigma-70 family RNA polymerase sigma factor [Candidatus Gastranaerophilales bacterium]